MSLVTRCPACATTFKVVRDQLRISDGWVRCGRCSHVFDATLDLHEAPDGPPATSAASPSASVSAPAAPIEPSSSDATEDADFFDDEPEHREPPEAAEPEAEPEPASTPAPAPAPTFALPAHGIVADELWTDFEANEPEWRPPASSLPPFPNIDLNLAAPPSPPPPPPPPLPALRLKAREMTASASEEDEKHEPEQDRDQVQMQKALRRARIKSAKIASAKARDERAAAKVSASMVREASEPEPGLRPSPLPSARDDAEDSERLPFSDNSENAGRGIAGFWQRPGARRWLWLLAVLAVLLLVVQVLRHERDGIVARQPNLRPAFASLCRVAGCELTALRQIGDIVIEGAAFAREKTGNNDYRLSFTLRNGAAVPLAMPAVELSLLDTQERAVVRRVLMASDYGAPAVLPARSDQAASLPLSLSAAEAATLPPIAGYRVEAFYP
ncbi:zinc-ribbon and DUF3426 domain-containing protein [Variovorax paradoxus]|uniref:Zinc finger/thioredoxin putative domain-containing protein n=1 Tax=Variovorax paradoxus TaxID=34073 RepID=A0A0H2LVH9_VARPD|nr:zinc-ribbon and DUF3426 domain-containing protein [Variovorax paradoxus]KLN54268.1 hypothetical protein VPARA_46170 [Variovorax paradoxus]